MRRGTFIVGIIFVILAIFPFTSCKRAVVSATLHGADIVRVHDVTHIKKAIKIADRIKSFIDLDIPKGPTREH